MVPKEAGNKSPASRTTPPRKASVTPKTKSTPKSKTTLTPKKSPKSRNTSSPKKTPKSKTSPSPKRKTTPASSKTQKPKPLTPKNKKTPPASEKKRKNSPASSKASNEKKQLSVEELKKFSGISAEHRSVIKFLTLKGVPAGQIYASMREVYAPKYPQFLTVQYWRKQFKTGRKAVMNDHHTKSVSQRKTLQVQEQRRKPKKTQLESEEADVEENHSEEVVAEEDDVKEQEEKDEMKIPELAAPKKALKRRVENDQKAAAKKQASDGAGKIKIKLSGFLRHSKKIR